MPKQFVIATRDAVRARVREALETGAAEIELDFCDTIHIDTVALGMLVTLRRASEEQGVTLTLRRVADDLWPVFEMHRLGQHFTFRG